MSPEYSKNIIVSLRRVYSINSGMFRFEYWLLIQISLVHCSHGADPKQDDYERYSHVLAQCSAIANEIHSHYERMFPGSVNEMTALTLELSTAPLTIKKKMVPAKPWNTSESLAEDEILSNRQSHASSFILRCWDGSGATSYDRSAATILLSDGPSSTIIFSDGDATCVAPSSGISK